MEGKEYLKYKEKLKEYEAEIEKINLILKKELFVKKLSDKEEVVAEYFPEFDDLDKWSKFPAIITKLVKTGEIFITIGSDMIFYVIPKESIKYGFIPGEGMMAVPYDMDEYGSGLNAHYVDIIYEYIMSKK